MKIVFLDLRRLLLGDTPATFLLEVIVRIFVVYVLLNVALRMMGKRMASQATRNELAALVVLAGGVGPAIQERKNGLLPPLIVALVVVGIQRLVATIAKEHGRFERLTQGTLTPLVDRGTIELHGLREVALSRLRVLEQLRDAGIKNLGEVQRMYLENNGAFTIVRAQKPRPGLSLVPGFDRDLREAQRKAEDGSTVCSKCGHDRTDGRKRCVRCGNDEREAAVV